MERKFPLREDSNRLRIAPPAEGRFPEPEIPIGNRTSAEPLSPTNNTNTWRSAEDRTGPSRTLSLLLNGKTGLELRTGSHEALALVVARELHEVLDEALGQILRLDVPLRSRLVGIARIEDRGIYARQCGRDFEIEDRELLRLGLVDRARREWRR